MVKAASGKTGKKAAASSPDATKEVEAAAKKVGMKKGKKEADDEEVEDSKEADSSKSSFKKPSLSNEEFMEKAKPLECRIMDGTEQVATFQLTPRHNNTGSVGWNSNEKVKITVGGEELNVNISTNATVSGSKPKQGKK